MDILFCVPQMLMSCAHITSYIYLTFELSTSFYSFARGTLQQRAERLFSLKGLDYNDFPKKVRAKGFVEK